MTAKQGCTTCDPTLLKHTYEMLRANALGAMNRATAFTVFLHHGMSAWMRLVAERGAASREVPQQSSSACTHVDADMPDAGLASILTDAILNATRPAPPLRGNP
jgi:hypothetical protein